jgi:endonuclease/exonuclease/phosphatase family metal-dependent hydrolase
LIALTTVAGLQLFRALLTGLVFYLNDAEEVAAPIVGLAALALSAMAFVVTPFVRRVGNVRALVVSAGGIGLARLAAQIVTRPAANLVICAVGLVLLSWFLPVVAMPRSIVPRGRVLALGMLIGVALDTLVKGGLGTMELSWRHDWRGYGVVAIIVAAQFLSLAGVGCMRRRSRLPASTARMPSLFGIGPALLVELMLLQNIGQQTVTTRWSQAETFVWISAGNAVAITLVWFLSPRVAKPAILLPAGLLLGVVVWAQPSGVDAALLQLIGSTMAALLIFASCVGSSRRARGDRKDRRSGSAIASGAGMVALVVLVLGYYGSYETALPLNRRLIAPLAVFALTGAALAGSQSWPAVHVRRAGLLVPAVLTILLLVVPVTHLVRDDRPAPIAGAGFPVRVMSYNLHQGFDPHGYPSVEKLADIIEQQRADVVALQEVSRAWLVTGAFDMLEWLSRRLDMPYAWGPAADDVFGNAVLSRFPMLDARTVDMPNNNELRLKRSFTSVTVDLGNDESLHVIATHLHAVKDEPLLRVPQVEALLSAWGQRSTTVVLGDFNMRPWEPEKKLLSKAGLRDAFRAAEVEGKGVTSRAEARIDYIWISPDLRVDDFSIGTTFASDHLPIAVTVRAAAG